MRIHIDERSVTVDFLFVGEKNVENVSFLKNYLRYIPIQVERVNY